MDNRNYPTYKVVEVLSLRGLLDNEVAPFRRGRETDVIVKKKTSSIRVQFVVRIMRYAATEGGLAKLQPSTRKL